MVSKDGKATVGAWVTVQDGELEELWRIVPRMEADVLRRWISEECPLARAVLGHTAGDVVQVRGPEGRRLVTVLAVQPAAGS
jgi:transcription elongation GreA/GreB family factor